MAKRELPPTAPPTAVATVQTWLARGIDVEEVGVRGELRPAHAAGFGRRVRRRVGLPSAVSPQKPPTLRETAQARTIPELELARTSRHARSRQAAARAQRAPSTSPVNQQAKKNLARTRRKNKIAAQAEEMSTTTQTGATASRRKPASGRTPQGNTTTPITGVAAEARQRL